MDFVCQDFAKMKDFALEIFRFVPRSISLVLCGICSEEFEFDIKKNVRKISNRSPPKKQRFRPSPR